ncbi:MAG TPA: portal protein [Pseudohongiella sp.]|nr:monovalent cation/H+ antiporter complex subunit F [Pseudomonadota bacterium]HBX36790.1 portal protein [Pseudohongiella sp.]|tara:strand:- start:1741 stop:2001 length:261 start_codon:yes stop_codon:yes gene_type:complete
MILMTTLLLIAGSAGLWRLGQATSTAERLMGLQMLGSTGIAVLLLLAEWQQSDTWRDVALVLALLAAVITAALVQLLRKTSEPEAP